MSKELEALERLKTAPSFMGGTAEYQFCTKSETLLMQDYETVKQALERLESIDNATLSEALKCLERIDNTLCLNNNKGKLEFGVDTEEHTDCDSAISMVEDLETIKQALIKAQEPKHYLKWEDLEFNHKPVFTEVKMGETIYKLVIGFDCTGKETIFLRTNNQQIVFHERDKQFFNDIHLERVEE